MIIILIVVVIAPMISVEVLYINRKLQKYFIQNRSFFTVIKLLLFINQDILNKRKCLLLFFFTKRLKPIGCSEKRFC